tara:strand:+ start:1736 stop:2134 length:399 start_codon:yes stop_codon:yes gene_type:complete
MARRKGGKSKGYQSKGQRRNVSRWSRNASRAENRANPSPQAIAQRAAYRRTIITSPHGKEELRLKEKFLAEDSVDRKCSELLKSFGSIGLTRAGAIHAIKTDHVSQLTEKWKSRASQKANKDKKKEKTYASQ